MVNDKESKEENPLVTGKKAIVHDIDGNEVVGEIVYQRKAEYGNPFEEVDNRINLYPALYKIVENKENDDFKVGKAVKGRKAIVHDIDGNEVVGEIVYQRKAIYKDPFSEK